MPEYRSTFPGVYVALDQNTGIGSLCVASSAGVGVCPERRSSIRDCASSEPGKRSSVPWSWGLAALSWCGLIAGTSSTVILPHDFFAWVATHIFTGEDSFRTFAAFWGYAWFAIVKGWHAAEFAILFALALTVLDRLARSCSRRNVALALALSLLFAVSDEYHQTFVPGRGGTWTDVAIDGLGAFVAGLVAWQRRSSADHR